MRALLWAGAHLQDLLLGVALAGQVQGGAHAGGQVEAEEGVRLRQLHAPQHHCLRPPIRRALHLLHGFLDVLPVLLHSSPIINNIHRHKVGLAKCLPMLAIQLHS